MVFQTALYLGCRSQPNAKQHRYGVGYGAVKSGGFTLIELMIVLLLVSIFLSFTLVNLKSGSAASQLQHVSRRLMHTITTLKTRAIKTRQVQALVIDFSNRKMWTANQGMKPEELAKAAAGAYVLPDAIRFMDVVFPGKGQVATGRTEVYFYPQGYSDQAIIHIENTDARRWSLVIEPFLPTVKLLQEYVTY